MTVPSNKKATWRRTMLRGYVFVVLLLAVAWAISLLDPVEEVLRDHRWIGFVLIVAMVALSVGAAWLASDRAATPVGQLERMRTDFVANASHELKTPVAGIRLLSESISQAAADGNDEAVRLFAERLDKESTRLQRLVGDLMDLSRLENGVRGPASQTVCDLAGVVATSFQGRAPKAAESGLSYTLEDETNGPLRAAISATDAALVVDNLLNNALAYTEQGGVTVRLAERDGMAELTVADTGIGIPVADQERVFERFYRVDTARSREKGGTGLGLSLVRHAVERAGGSVGLVSEPGCGSTFTVRLPLA